jgi:hypothetical protein
LLPVIVRGDFPATTTPSPSRWGICNVVCRRRRAHGPG